MPEPVADPRHRARLAVLPVLPVGDRPGAAREVEPEGHRRSPCSPAPCRSCPSTPSATPPGRPAPASASDPTAAPRPTPSPIPEDLRLMCGLLAYFSTDADRVDDDTVAGVREAQHCMRHRGPDETEAWSDNRAVFGFNRLSIIDVEQQPPAAALRRRPVPDRLQRGDLQLPGAARGARRRRRRVRHRGRHRGDRRRLPPLGRGRRAAAARHVRVRDLGHRDRDGVRRAGPVRHQAAVHTPGWPTAGSPSPRRRRRCSNCSAASKARRRGRCRRRCSTT